MQQAHSIVLGHLCMYQAVLSFAFGQATCCTVVQDMSKEEEKRLEEELKGTYETISLDANGQALVERRDVWGGSGSSLGLRFG